MSINEALKILGLNNNYTEEELKKAYRKLIVKYHPDKYQENNTFAENKTYYYSIGTESDNPTSSFTAKSQTVYFNSNWGGNNSVNLG